MYAQDRLVSKGLREGTPVEVTNHFTGSWTRGFEVAALHHDGCQVRRVSDGAVLPLDFDYSNVRATLREKGR